MPSNPEDQTPAPSRAAPYFRVLSACPGAVAARIPEAVPGGSRLPTRKGTGWGPWQAGRVCGQPFCSTSGFAEAAVPLLLLPAAQTIPSPGVVGIPRKGYPSCPQRDAPQSLRKGARHVTPGIPRETLPPPHGRELLELPANRTQVAGQQVQILPRRRQPVMTITHRSLHPLPIPKAKPEPHRAGP
jgi:hypothetical protein